MEGGRGGSGGDLGSHGVKISRSLYFFLSYDRRFSISRVPDEVFFFFRLPNQEKKNVSDTSQRFL